MKKVYLKPEMLVVQLQHKASQMLLVSNKMVRTVNTNLGTGDELIRDENDGEGDAWGDAM